LVEEQDGVLHAVHSLPGLRLVDGAAMIGAEAVWKPNYLNFGFPLPMARSIMAAARLIRSRPIGSKVSRAIFAFEFGFCLRQYVIEPRCHRLLHQTLCG
jgi:hypothetical protein